MPDRLGRMTHEERLALIYRPFFIQRFDRSYPDAGVIIGDHFPTGHDGKELLCFDEIERAHIYERYLGSLEGLMDDDITITEDQV